MLRAFMNSVCPDADNSLNAVYSGNLLSTERSWRWLRCSKREVSGARKWPPHIPQRLPAVAEKQASSRTFASIYTVVTSVLYIQHFFLNCIFLILGVHSWASGPGCVQFDSFSVWMACVIFVCHCHYILHTDTHTHATQMHTLVHRLVDFSYFSHSQHVCVIAYYLHCVHP